MTTEEEDAAVIPPAVMALVPDDHPHRAGLLRDLAAFYVSGGWTVERRRRVRPIYDAIAARIEREQAEGASREDRDP
ncbi:MULTISPECIES: hypothetical protein [Protofrankia]|uniref:Uncharacterized protein n=1 Tax=Protofrankia coriariae TaxID=1562887 RepID=A0ABR5F592_9ACTN|nr:MULTISPECIES: hypothetical protein [Protofrankia]KLL11854.1 hypothetical protein FrCorBMG51_08500 [Protofrankia coriariae]ONH34263.1 hypothetical protein BL254_17235 [Protofrankia sp. BMG5.30]